MEAYQDEGEGKPINKYCKKCLENIPQKNKIYKSKIPCQKRYPKSLIYVLKKTKIKIKTKNIIDF